MEEGLIESTGFAFGIDALLPRVLLGPLLICILPCHRSSFRPAMPGFLESLSLIPLAMRMGERLVQFHFLLQPDRIWVISRSHLINQLTDSS